MQNGSLVMNKPKYQTGDCVGNWLITNSYFALWLNEWVYHLEAKKGKSKLTCTENILDFINK